MVGAGFGMDSITDNFLMRGKRRHGGQSFEIGETDTSENNQPCHTGDVLDQKQGSLSSLAGGYFDTCFSKAKACRDVLLNRDPFCREKIQSRDKLESGA